MPPKNFTGAQVTQAIRPLPDVWAGLDEHGRWVFYEVDNVCLDEKRADACRLADVCDDKCAEDLGSMEALGLIVFISVNTPTDVCVLTKKRA